MGCTWAGTYGNGWSPGRLGHPCVCWGGSCREVLHEGHTFVRMTLNMKTARILPGERPMSGKGLCVSV